MPRLRWLLHAVGPRGVLAFGGPREGTPTPAPSVRLGAWAWGFLHDPSNRCTTQIQERPGSRSCTWSD